MNNCTIVSGSNERFFPLVQGLINSIREIETLNCFDITIIDAGLSDDNRNWLDVNGVRCLDINTMQNIDLSFAKINKHHHGYMSIVRPHLGDICSEYETVIWLDADTWVQTDTAFGYLLEAARKNKIGIVTQASRLHTSVMTIRTNRLLEFFRLTEPRGILYKNACRARLPYTIRKTLINRAVLNCGVFSLDTKASHWKYWQDWQKRCIKYGRYFTSDQLSLAIVVYSEKLECELLPDICNLMESEGYYRYDTRTSEFTDKYIPFTPASIIHMAGIENKLDANTNVVCRNENNRDTLVKINHHSRYTNKEIETTE